MKILSPKLLWTVWALAVAAVLVREFGPQHLEPSRLERLPVQAWGVTGRDVPLNEAEATVFHHATVVKRVYQAGANRFVLLAVDGAGDRHALHDPHYCFRGAGWTVLAEEATPLPGGWGRIVHLRRGGERAEACYWFTDGRRRHDSQLRVGWHAALRRLGIQGDAQAPVLVLLQPIAGSTVDWPDVLRRFPELAAL